MNPVGTALEALEKCTALYGAGRPDLALKEIERGLAAMPDAGFLHMMHGSILAALERYREALAAYDRAALVEDPAWHAQRTTCLSKLRRHDAAEAASDEAIRLAPGDGLVWYRRGAALVRAGGPKLHLASGRRTYERGRDALRRAVELDPGGYLARSDLALVYAAIGGGDPEPLIREALALKPGDPRVHAAAAELALAAGRIGEAASHADVVISACPGAPASIALLRRVRRAQSSRLARWMSRTTRHPHLIRPVAYAVGFPAGLAGAMAGVTRAQFFLGMGLLGVVIALWASFEHFQLKRAMKAPVLSKDF